jgi:DNA-binding Lrp family transcriptional regulator
MKNVREVFMIYGAYDLIALVEASTLDEVKNTITYRIRKLSGVDSTLTMVVVYGK